MVLGAEAVLSFCCHQAVPTEVFIGFAQPHFLAQASLNSRDAMALYKSASETVSLTNTLCQSISADKPS